MGERSSGNHAGSRRGTGAAALFVLVAAGALALRVALLCSLRTSPTFLEPIVDAESYDVAARSLAQGNGLSEGFFWQPFLYPLFLSTVYKLFGLSVIAGKTVQIALGSLSCGFAAVLGRRLFDWRTGLLAGVILALYAPLAFLETELIASVLEGFWATALVWFFVALRCDSRLPTYCLLGLCGGLSAITRPTFIPFFAAACTWHGFVLFRASVPFKRVISAASLVVLGFLLAVEPVAWLKYTTITRSVPLPDSRGAEPRGRHFQPADVWGFLPDSGGINLYIGNNPDSERTIAIRPGWAWDRLTLEPGPSAVLPRDAQAYFGQKALEYVVRDPLGFAAGLADKSLQFLSSREIPRNIDIYLFREWSPLLSLLVWKWGAFGFPFGLLLPLSVIGLTTQRKRIPPPVWLFIILYPAAVVLVFVAGRYRMPVLPLLAVAASAGILHLAELARTKRWGRLGAWGIAGVVVVLVASAPGPFIQEKTDYKAEMFYCLGRRFFNRKQDSEAVRFFEQALKSRGEYPEVFEKLGLIAERQGNLAQAETFYRRALSSNPNFQTVYEELGHLLVETGRVADAEPVLRRAVELDPSSANAHANLGILLGMGGRHQEALREFLSSVRLRPDHAGYLTNLGAVLFRMGRTNDAIRCYERALSLDPSLTEARANLSAALQQLRNGGTGAAPGR